MGTCTHACMNTYMHACVHTYILDLTASWLSHLALAIYMFVVVNFDALAQASDIRIERRQVVFLCWFEPKVSDTYSPADWMPADKPTELSRIKLKNLNSTAPPYDQQAFSPLDLTASRLAHLALAMYMFVVVNTYAWHSPRGINLSSSPCTPLYWTMKYQWHSGYIVFPHDLITRQMSDK